VCHYPAGERDLWHHLEWTEAVKQEFSIRWINFEAWCETVGIQALRKTIEQRMNLFGYRKMHLMSHISESIRWMASGVNFTTDVSERLHIANLKEAYRFSNKIKCIWEMLEHNDRCTGLDYMEETLSYLALEGWYNTDSAKVFNQLSATDTRRDTRRAHLLCLQTIQDEPIILPVSQQLYHFREMHVRGVCRSIKLTVLRDASEDFGNPSLDSDSAPKLKGTWDTKFVDSCSDMIRICSYTVYWLNSRMGCCITVNHFTTRLLLSVWDLIAR